MAQPVLLALSSFRHTEAVVAHALELCAERTAPLVVVFVVDVNLARYFVGSDVMAGTSLRELMEQGILDDHKRQAQEALSRVCALAREHGLPCTAVLRVGRFAQEIKAAAREHAPAVIVLTRARRPEWLRRVFGSPVDRLCQELGGQCDVWVV